MGALHILLCVSLSVCVWERERERRERGTCICPPWLCETCFVFQRQETRCWRWQARRLSRPANEAAQASWSCSWAVEVSAYLDRLGQTRVWRVNKTNCFWNNWDQLVFHTRWEKSTFAVIIQTELVLKQFCIWEWPCVSHMLRKINICNHQTGLRLQQFCIWDQSEIIL